MDVVVLGEAFDVMGSRAPKTDGQNEGEFTREWKDILWMMIMFFFCFTLPSKFVTSRRAGEDLVLSARLFVGAWLREWVKD